MNDPRRREISEIISKLDYIRSSIHVLTEQVKDIGQAEESARAQMPDSLFNGAGYGLSEQASRHLGKAEGYLTTSTDQLDAVIWQLAKATS